MHRDAVMQPSLCAEAGIREGWLLRLAGEKCNATRPRLTVQALGWFRRSQSQRWFLSPGLHELALQSPRPKATSPPPPGAFAVDRRRRHEKGFAESTKTVPIPVPATHS